jgi:uncharacterized coiled-coil DUF342 family protein
MEPDGDSAPRRDEVRPEADEAQENVVNKPHDYRALEREFVTSQISLRESCRRHNISAHSLVTVQAKKGKWREKREAYRAKESESFIARHAARHADRQAEINDKVLEAIDKFREDLKATKLVRQPGGSVTEEPAWLMTPKDLCLLIDRFQVLSERPAVISQHQGLSVTSELSFEAMMEFLERTRGRAGPSPMEESPLPRTRRPDD